MDEPSSDYGIWTNPKPIGHWVLYSHAPTKMMFSMYAKPTDEQIKNTEELLGWTWKDAE